MSTTPPPSTPLTEIDAIILQLRPRLRQALSFYRIPHPDSEDLVQEVLMAAFRKWDVIHTKDAWILGTLRNKCSMYWKQRRSDRLQPVDSDLLEGLSEPLPPVQERAELMWDLESVFGSLCPRHRTVLWLRYGLGLSTTEVAKRTGYHHSSIRKLTCRSVARLQRELTLSPRAGPKPA